MSFGRNRSRSQTQQQEQSTSFESSSNLQDLLSRSVGLSAASSRGSNQQFSAGSGQTFQRGGTRSSFYAPAQGSINDVIGQADRVYQDRLGAGPRILGFDSLEDEGFGALAGLARDGGINQAAYDQGLAEIRGDYLGQDAPGLQAVRDRVQRGVTQQVNDTFGGAGRTASGQHQRGLSEGLAEGLGQVEYGNYQQERDRQVAARNAAAGLQGARYADADVLRGVGEQRRGLAQQQRFDAIDSPQSYLNDRFGLLGSIAGLAGETDTSQFGRSQDQQQALSLLDQLSTQLSVEEQAQLARAFENASIDRSGTGSGTTSGSSGGFNLGLR